MHGQNTFISKQLNSFYIYLDLFWQGVHLMKKNYIHTCYNIVDGQCREIVVNELQLSAPLDKLSAPLDKL